LREEIRKKTQIGVSEDEGKREGGGRNVVCRDLFEGEGGGGGRPADLNGAS